MWGNREGYPCWGNMFNMVSFSFVRRSGNRVAHELAKLSGNVSDTTIFFDNFLNVIHCCVMKDIEHMNE